MNTFERPIFDPTVGMRIRFDDEPLIVVAREGKSVTMQSEKTGELTEPMSVDDLIKYYHYLLETVSPKGQVQSPIKFASDDVHLR